MTKFTYVPISVLHILPSSPLSLSLLRFPSTSNPLFHNLFSLSFCRLFLPAYSQGAAAEEEEEDDDDE